MVICKFFQTGNCRFGTKCANEHFDVKQLIKTEVEAAIQGRQWPLSNFGPFKEKPCFPNFIEDQSFEEIRYHCYESKKQNYFQNFEQQFNQQIMEAQNKMKTLLTLNREIVDIVTNIYDSNSETGQQKQSTFSGNSNPFATIGNNNNPQQTGSLFGNQQQQVNPFSKSNTQTGFGSNTTGIFGGSGQPSSAAIIGQSTFGNSIFGGAATAQTVQPSIFTSPVRQQQQAPFGTFGPPSQPQSSNIFNQPAQQQQPTGSIFGAQIQQPQPQPTFGPNIFAQPIQNAPQQTNLFGAAVQPSIFPQPNQPIQQPTGFGGFVQTVNEQKFPSQQQTQNLFGVQQNPLQQQSIFGTQQQTQQQSQQAPHQTQQQPSLTNIFAHAQQQPNQQQPNQGPVQSQQTIFGANNQQQLTQPNVNQMTPAHLQFSSNPYSKMEDLSEEDIEAFKAEKFTPGKIPRKPPPRELC